ncbi:MAG: hypothetical protein ACWGIK_23405 [Achromobacter pulmonis]
MRKKNHLTSSSVANYILSSVVAFILTNMPPLQGNLTDMNEDVLVMSEKLLTPLHRHFISIMCIDEGTNAKEKFDGAPAIYNFSAFVIEICDHWFGITAGHIFEELVNAKKSGSILTNWMIDDSAVSSNPMPPTPIPFDIERNVHYFHDSPTEGMDYAVFSLNSYLIRRALENQGIFPIRPNQWRGNDFGEYPHWLLIGIPTALATLKYGKKFEKLIATIPLERCELPYHQQEKEYENLHARILFDQIDSGHKKFEIDGVSGGPVFAVKFNNEGIVDYKLLGIQSSITGEVVNFCAAQPFLEVLETTFGNALKE